jgi:putative membrane protein
MIMDMMSNWDCGSGWGMGFIGPLLTILIVGGLIFLIIYLVNHTKGRSYSSSNSPEDRSLEILKERYAQGEIDDEEYERRNRMLR